MARLTRTAKYADLREQLANDKEENVASQDLSSYQNRLDNVQDTLSFNPKKEEPKPEVKEEVKVEVKPEVKEEVKVEAPKAEAPKAEAKAETKTTAKATATKATAAKKAAAPKKEAAPKAAKKAAEIQTSVNVEFSGKVCTPESLIASAKDVWQYDMGRDVAEIKTLNVYLKPEESTAYFVVNGEETGNFFI